MNNETEAPERIWIYSDINDHFNPAKDDWSSGHWDTEQDASTSSGRQYVRADLSDAKDARIAELEAALIWYGEQARLARLIHKEGDAGRHAIASDGGKRARSTLAELKGGE